MEDVSCAYSVVPCQNDVVCSRFWFVPSEQNSRLNIFDEPNFTANIRKSIQVKSLIRAYPQSPDSAWFKVYTENGAPGWICTETPGGLQQLEKATRFARFQEWPGRNKFFFQGKVMFGPDLSIFSFLNFGIFLLFMLHVIFSFPRLNPSLFRLFGSFMGCFLFFLLVYNLWSTALTDPGIIPRNPPYLVLDPPDEKDIEEEESRLLYCQQCNIFRPKKSKHCILCDNCVDNLDHHCGVIGNCIGKRNFHFFVRFLFYSSVVSLFLCACDASVLLKILVISKKDTSQEILGRLIDTFIKEPLLIVLLGTTCHIGTMTFTFTCFQCFMIGIQNIQQPQNATWKEAVVHFFKHFDLSEIIKNVIGPVEQSPSKVPDQSVIIHVNDNDLNPTEINNIL